MAENISQKKLMKIQSKNKNILCSKHKLKCNSFKLNSKNPKDIFMCSNCLILENQSNSQVLTILDITQSNTQSVLLNWPPLNEQNLLGNLLAMSSLDNAPISESNQIKNFFQEFESQILQKINEKKKSFLNSSQQNHIKREKILSVYQQIANFNEFDQIISDDQTNDQNKSESISQIISQKNEQKAQNTKLLKEQNIQQESENYFKETIFNTFKKSIISQLDLLDLNNPPKLEDQCILIQSQIQIPLNNLQKNQPNYQNNIQENNNLNNIIKIINENNRCSPAYLNSLKVELNKISALINSLNIEKNNIYQPPKLSPNLNQQPYQQQQPQYRPPVQQQSPIIYQQPSTNINPANISQQLPNIQQKQNVGNPDPLQKQSNAIQTQENEISNVLRFVQLMNHFSYRYVQNNSNKKNQLQSKLEIFNKVLYYSKFTEQQIQNLNAILKNFPKFELIKIKYEFKIVLSGHNNSLKNGKIQIIDGIQSFEVQNNSAQTTSYIKINQTSRYRIRIKLHFTQQKQKHFFIGFIKDQDKDNTNINDISKVVSFNTLNQSQNFENIEIVIQFCVKERKFEIIDSPKSLSLINDEKHSMIDATSTYHLGLELFNIGDKISILEFVEFI